MGIYVNKKPFVYPQNKPADDAAAQAAETWRAAHANDPVIEPLFDERGKQVNYLDRSEVLLANEPTYTVIQISDGTVRKDNKTAAPPVPPVDQNPKPQYRYTSEDRARLHSEDRVMIQCGGGAGMRVIEKERPDNPFSSRRREP